MDSKEKWCFKILGKVSRSFSMVIQQLPGELKKSICIFYLVLRALDTIEDDMTTFTNSEKKTHLQQFYMYLREKSIHNLICGENYEKELILNFDTVLNVLYSLPLSHQNIIIEISRQMGYGMSKYIDGNLMNGTEKISDYNEYCYYVAGLVGTGLTQLFVVSGYEDNSILDNPEYAIHMGIFLQKTNIIRDFLEDMNEGRTFWPKEIWGKYSEQLKDIPYDKNIALCVLNDMIHDSISHIYDCLMFLKKIKHYNIFRFCAIPQVMAISTLAKLSNNYSVFEKTVKLDKMTTMHLIEKTQTFPMVCKLFFEQLYVLHNNISKTIDHANKILLDEKYNKIMSYLLHNYE